MLDPVHVHKINLIEVLLEDAELHCPPGRCVEPPPEDEVLDWPEDRIRAYFAQQLAALSLGPSLPGPAGSLPSELPCQAVLPARAISADGGPERHSGGTELPSAAAPRPASGAAETAETAEAAETVETAETAETAAAEATSSVRVPAPASAAATGPAVETGDHTGASSSCGCGGEADGRDAAQDFAEATSATTSTEGGSGGSGSSSGSGGSSGAAQLTETEWQQLFQRWFPGLPASGTATASPRMRVLAFHSSGNAEDMWTSEGTGARRAKSPLLEWCRGRDVELLAVQLPGRAARLREPFLDSAQDFAAQLLPVLAPLLAQRNVPYALVSHSLGCWLAFELLRAARAARLPAPAAWCLSAMPAPDLPEAQRPWRQQRSLGTADFQEEVRGWDVNEVVFSPDMWQMYEPILRADFKLFDEYQMLPSGSSPVAVGRTGGALHDVAVFDDLPITAFYGTRDRRVTPALMEGWQRFTTGPFQLLAVPGNHLWPLNDRDSKAAWLACVVAALQDVAEDTGLSRVGA
ncbi:hypothetical protein CHLRE_09g388900v5 [Chlamydomonas reinhardtii]|uniref:Thioesterase domain-containing protein n=1 Tax=Chlamydomonas reinhardtii TaxID=3055 RepID=A0A2K3DDP2_CHLRE|nr:uncharacterized protein CHLRE_09g388900v5 [Chlamydomonas reinhardtii]PNW78637.1 hypothetical protein CHLRE_09g388900v5 [Chlamydomonas reinhardtii]